MRKTILSKGTRRALTVDRGGKKGCLSRNQKRCSKAVGGTKTAHLECKSKGSTRTFPLQDGVQTEVCRLVIPEDGKISWDPKKIYCAPDCTKVSRQHAVIKYEQGVLKITDISKHGTWKNGTRLDKDVENVINLNDTLFFGENTDNCSIRFVKVDKVTKMLKTLYNIYQGFMPNVKEAENQIARSMANLCMPYEGDERRRYLIRIVIPDCHTDKCSMDWQEAGVKMTQIATAILDEFDTRSIWHDAQKWEEAIDTRFPPK